jgi:hypothetical protein
MKHIIHDSCQQQLQIQAPTDMKQTRSFQENNNLHTPTTHSSQNDLQTSLDTIQRLTQELQQARAEINSLRSQTDKLQQVYLINQEVCPYIDQVIDSVNTHFFYSLCTF